MPGIYDRSGRPIDIVEFDRLLTDPGYKVVARTEVGSEVVSTVWLGIDHSFGGDVPLIFETMIFGDGCFAGDCWRYGSEIAARAGHDQAVALVNDRARI